MRANDKKLFNDRQNLVTMLNLRRSGTTLTTLALFYKCDRSSIGTQCKKYGIYPLTEPIGIESTVFNVAQTLVPSQVKADERWEVIDGEKVNRGKNYADYLKQYPPRKGVSYW